MSTTSTSSGWNRSNSTPKPAPKKPSAMRGVVAGLVVVALAAACVVMFMGKDEDRVAVKQNKKQSRIAEVAHAVNSPVRQVAPTAKMRPEKVDQDSSTSNLVAVAAPTNYVPGSGVRRFPDRKPTFDTVTEMVLARLFSTRLGDPPPMLPQIPLRELKDMQKIINRKMKVDEKYDSEQIREMKEIGDMAKEEFRKFLEQGGDDTEFIDYYQGKLKHYNDEWKDAMKSVIDVAKEGDPSITRAYLDAVNEKLSAKGIKSVKLPPKFQREIEGDQQ